MRTKHKNKCLRCLVTRESYLSFTWNPMFLHDFNCCFFFKFSTWEGDNSHRRHMSQDVLKDYEKSMIVNKSLLNIAITKNLWPNGDEIYFI